MKSVGVVLGLEKNLVLGLERKSWFWPWEKNFGLEKSLVYVTEIDYLRQMSFCKHENYFVLMYRIAQSG